MSICYWNEDYTLVERAFSILNEKYEPRGASDNTHQFWAERPTHMNLKPVKMAVEHNAIEARYDFDTNILTITVN